MLVGQERLGALGKCDRVLRSRADLRRETQSDLSRFAFPCRNRRASDRRERCLELSQALVVGDIPRPASDGAHPRDDGRGPAGGDGVDNGKRCASAAHGISERLELTSRFGSIRETGRDEDDGMGARSRARREIVRRAHELADRRARYLVKGIERVSCSHRKVGAAGWNSIHALAGSDGLKHAGVASKDVEGLGKRQPVLGDRVVAQPSPDTRLGIRGNRPREPGEALTVVPRRVRHIDDDQGR